jgi:PAS domain S-box-containing protein
MLRNPSEEVQRGSHARPALPGIGAIGLAFAVGIAYFFAAKLGLALRTQPDGVAVFWPAVGVSSGVLIALGRDARLPVVGGTMVATFIATLTGGQSVWGATVFALCDAGETLLTAWLIERYFGSDFSLDRLRDVLGLLVAAAVATAAAGVGGTVAYKLFHSPTAPIWMIWLHWFASDAVGIITVAPLVIGLAKALREPPPRKEVIEGVLALFAVAAMTVIIVFAPAEPCPVALLFPILLWLGARCRPVFAAAAAFVVSLTMVCTITFGIGYFGNPTNPISASISGAQAAILGFALTAYVLAALFAERRECEVVLQGSEARLQEALAGGEVMAFECDIGGGPAQRSQNTTQVLGIGPQQALTAEQFLARLHPDDRERLKEYHRRARVDSPAMVIFRFMRPDDQEVWLEETSRTECDAAGRPVRVKGLVRDITRRKVAEERQNLLIAELDHRVKNVLARVAAVVRQTRRRFATIDEFVKSLDGRIQSIATAHALLSQSRWHGVGLADLVRRQLAPYTTDTNTVISGPDVTLTSAETQAVAIVMHELVTNAAKYGALSSPNGRVSVRWDRTGADAAAILTITWRELGGPPIAAPVQTGYGSSVIRDLIPHELGGTVNLIFLSDGACCKIEIPLEAGAKSR